MNGYKAFFNGKEIEVYAATLLEAKTKAVAADVCRRTTTVAARKRTTKLKGKT